MAALSITTISAWLLLVQRAVNFFI